MASDVSICNSALVVLGVDRIMSLTEDSEPARKCNAVYEQFRDEELVAHTWRFAVTRVGLARTDNAPEYDYTYEYQLPTDCLRVLDIDTETYSYRIEGNKLLTNDPTPTIRYIKKITDPNIMTLDFIQVLSARIAYELAFALTGSKTVMGDLYDIYTKKRRRAVAVDSQSSGTPYNIHSDRFVDSRSGSIY